MTANNKQINFGGSINVDDNNNREDFILSLDGALVLIKQQVIAEYDRRKEELQ